jgi:hypothetical protein
MRVETRALNWRTWRRMYRRKASEDQRPMSMMVKTGTWEVLWAGDREPGGSFELPSWEVLWAGDREPGGSFELPSWEVLWLSTSLAGTGCDDSVL